jgi:hypothetical protein
MKGYKVRITQAPKKGNYSGQSQYGLDVGARKVEGFQSQNPFDYVKNTLKEVPRDEANIEAEHGETAIGDFNGDGVLTHGNIGGKPHSRGGTPLNVPDNTFLFSNTKSLKIKDKNALEYFNMPNKKGGYTPAEIDRKRYGDLNKFISVLQDPNADQYSKTTAALNRANIMQKKGMLALVQESMKGFPQGVPDISKPYLPEEQIAAIEGASTQNVDNQESMEMPTGQYGGLPIYDYAYGGYLPLYQGAGQKVSEARARELEATGEWKRVPGSNRMQKVVKGTKIPGQAGTAATVEIGPAMGGRRGSEDEYWRNFLIPQLESGVTPEELATKKPGSKGSFMSPSNIEKARQYYKPKAGTPATKDMCQEPGYAINPATGECEKIEELTVEADPTGGGGKPVPGTYDVKKKMYDGRYMYADINNIARASLIPPNLYFPYEAQPMASVPEPTFYDPERELAKQSSDARMLAEYSAQMDPQAYSARARGLQSGLIEGAADTMGRYQNLNVGVANQYSGLQSEMMNRLNEARVARTNRIAAGNAITRQYGDNAWREYIDRVGYPINVAERNKMNRNILNATYPYVNLDRSGMFTVNPGDYTSMITGQASAGMGSAQDDAAMLKEINEERKRIKLENPDLQDTDINAYLQRKYPNFYNKRNGSNASADYLEKMKQISDAYRQSIAPGGVTSIRPPQGAPNYVQPGFYPPYTYPTYPGYGMADNSSIATR